MEARRGQAPSKGTGTGEGTTGQLRVREQHVWLVPWGEVNVRATAGEEDQREALRGGLSRRGAQGRILRRLCPVLSCDRGMGEGAWEAEPASRLGLGACWVRREPQGLERARATPGQHPQPVCPVK